MMWITSFVAYTFVLGLSISVCEAGPRYPVIVVPGDGGSQLEVKLNKSSSPHYICTKYTSDFTSLWLNLEELLPEVIDCFVENMKLVYDNKTHTTQNIPGVDIRITDFGGTSGVEWLDSNILTHVTSAVSYFYPIVNDLVSIGYERGKSIRGAPFDFRKAPNEFQKYNSDVKHLVEEAYTMNNNTKVVLIGHSMGNPVTLYFLNQQTQEWKDKYIQSFISVAGVWGGAVKTLRLMASGDSLGVVIVKPITVRPMQRTFQSTTFLMPSDQFWKPHEPLVLTEHRNYTVADYMEYFRDLNYPTGYLMWKDVQNLIKDLTPPGVPVHCIHGSGVGTPAGFQFPPGTFPDTYPKVIEGDGDGTVNMRSLLGCLRWHGRQKYPVKHLVLKGETSEHMAILAHPQVSKYILNVVTGGKR